MIKILTVKHCIYTMRSIFRNVSKIKIINFFRYVEKGFYFLGAKLVWISCIPLLILGHFSCKQLKYTDLSCSIRLSKVNFSSLSTSLSARPCILLILLCYSLNYDCGVYIYIYIYIYIHYRPINIQITLLETGVFRT